MTSSTRRTTATGPSRASQYGIFFALILALWAYCLSMLPQFPSQLPLWLTVTVGAMALGNIGYHLFTFRDCPEAYHELQNEISMAKAELALKGLE